MATIETGVNVIGVGHGHDEERVVELSSARHAERAEAYVQFVDAAGELSAIHDGLAAVRAEGCAGQNTLGVGDRCLYISG